MKLFFINTELPRTLSVRYLGLHIDEKLCWSVYITFPSLLVANYLGLLFRFREAFTKETLCILYHSLIYSRIQYGVTIWNIVSKTYLHKIKVKQNTAICTTVPHLIFTNTSIIQFFKT